MPSPFPGMDPYLEHPVHWSDFHTRFVNYWCEAVAATLPPQYSARMNERVYLVEGLPPERKLIVPDVAVERDPFPQAGVAVATKSVTLRPTTIPLVMLDEVRQSHIEILHRPERSLVAVLELLSPANKEEPGRSEYLIKRNRLLNQSVSILEVDLLFGGKRIPLREAYPAGHYFALLSRAGQRPDCEVYAWTLPEPLPDLPVPLRAPDADVVVDLAAVFATVYERGRFAHEIDYAQSPPMPLSDEGLRWVSAVVQTVGKTQ